MDRPLTQAVLTYMAPEKTSNRFLTVFGLAVFLLAPSFDTALKYFGVAGVVGYFTVGTILVFAAEHLVLPVLRERISERTATILAAVTFALLTAIALVLYPMANAGRFGGGSDADDALVVAVTELLRGHYPYTLSTYLGNPISPMPGAVFLAIPFVVLGAIQLQNIFWLAFFFLVFRYFEKNAALALGLVWAMLVFSPTLLQNIVTGADYASNSIYILVLMWILTLLLAESGSATWKRVIPAILLGVALSSRSTFILMMPVFLSVLVQRAGWKEAIKYLAITGVTFLAVTLPFWLYDPAGFAPLRVQSEKLKGIEDILPHAGIIIPGITGMIAIGLSFQNMKTDTARFFRNCAIVQLFVLFVTSAIYSIKLGHVDFFLQQSGYGMFSLVFGATAFWMYLYNERTEITT
ncbi:MAG: hypothetical protein QM785_16240 [Pyrinomonadaceae bacterium]